MLLGMRIGHDPRRDTSGRYAVEQLCDACGKPIHGEHVTDDEVCGNTSGPGFYLCQRDRCGKKLEKMSAPQRRTLYEAQRAANERSESSRPADASPKSPRSPRANSTNPAPPRKKSPATLMREITEFISPDASAKISREKRALSSLADDARERRPGPAEILRDNAGAKVSKRIPHTGTIATLYDAREAGMGVEGGRWKTVCEDHGSIVAHATRRDAIPHLASPEEWCEECREK